ncbi:hypothetical protein ATANTOWER_012860 [Ataeniobius toweri]|uniref:Uncharacterized protein n=1 Tax=Ataeniobius toweri TaxID=208326 RepID=A0ABU7BG16_9TELE|nr:hypothetical protein [Ataeniobius toweri]
MWNPCIYINVSNPENTQFYVKPTQEVVEELYWYQKEEKKIWSRISSFFGNTMPKLFCMVIPSSTEVEEIVGRSTYSSYELFLESDIPNKDQMDLPEALQQVFQLPNAVEVDLSDDPTEDVSNESKVEIFSLNPGEAGDMLIDFSVGINVFVDSIDFQQDHESEESPSGLRPEDMPETDTESLGSLFDTDYAVLGRNKESVLRMTEGVIKLVFKKSVIKCDPKTLETMKLYYFKKLWKALEKQSFSITPQKEKNVKRIFKRLTKKIGCELPDLIFLLATYDQFTQDTLVECFQNHLRPHTEKPTFWKRCCSWFKEKFTRSKTESSSSSVEAGDSLSKKETNAAVRLLVRQMLDETMENSRSLPEERIRESVVRLFNKVWAELEGKALDITPNKIPEQCTAILEDLYKNFSKRQLLSLIDLDIPRVDKVVVSCVIKHLTNLKDKHSLF